MENETSAAHSAIDRDFGMRQSGDDEELYIWALKRFAKDNKSASDQINCAIRAGDIALAHRLTHTLKGAAGSLGAIKLYDAARAVEYALSNDCMREGYMRHLEASLNAVLKELEPLMKETAAKKPASSALNVEKALALIAELAPLLQSCNTRSFSLVPEIIEILTPAGGACELLIEQIEDCNFQLAAETLHKIEQLIKSGYRGESF